MGDEMTDRPKLGHWDQLPEARVLPMLDRIADGIAVIGPDWRFLYLNQPAAELLRRPREALVGRTMTSYFGTTGSHEWRRALERCVHAGEPFVIAEYYPPLDRWFESRGFPQDGNVVVLFRDITGRMKADEALGLSRRRMRAIIDHSPSVISVKDLDGRYVMANAECGRLLGTSAEAVVGRLCRELFPEIAEEQLARDHRAVEQAAPVYDESMLMRDGEPRTYETVTFTLPDSSGRATETCTIATDVTERRELDSERRRRLDCASRIGSALREGRILVYAQPIVEIDTGREIGAELLVRMGRRDDAEGVLEPGAFLPESERYGLVQAIDTFMVSQALALAGSLQPRVNLSAVTLCDPGARREILALLRGQRAAAANLVFEITETAIAEQLAAAERFAAELTELGCGLALDDFGTGFGSFTYLRRLPLRYLKIDRSFVTGLVSSEEDRRVVQSIVTLADQFNLLAVAEGVEDEATLAALRELGAQYAQGYHLGRPAPAVPLANA